MNSKISLAILTATIVTIGLQYISYRQTCTADNQAYQSALKNWGKTNSIDLSRALTRMQSDKCKVEGVR